MNDSRQNREAREWAEFLEDGGSPDPILPAKAKELTSHFWGRAWNLWLPTLTAYESRMPKGRTLLRKGKVFELRVEAGLLTARVLEGGLWTVRIVTREMDPETAAQFAEQAGRDTHSVAELLSGAAGDGLMTLALSEDGGLFPAREQIKAVCDCLDDADFCAHSAAVLYAAGVWFDTQPGDFFVWRAFDLQSFAGDTSRLAQALTESGGTPEIDLPRSAEQWAAILGVEIDEEAFEDWLATADPPPPSAERPPLP